MIDVQYNRNGERFELTMTGHAESGEAGHDIVCAAASMLVFTLAANLSTLEAEGEIEIERLTFSSGFADIGCTGSKAESVFDTICRGFELLARDKPKNVKFTFE